MTEARLMERLTNQIGELDLETAEEILRGQGYSLKKRDGDHIRHAVYFWSAPNRRTIALTVDTHPELVTAVKFAD